jgi:hypothetical protein
MIGTATEYRTLRVAGEAEKGHLTTASPAKSGSVHDQIK